MLMVRVRAGSSGAGAAKVRRRLQAEHWQRLQRLRPAPPALHEDPHPKASGCPHHTPTLQGLTALAATFLNFLIWFPPWGGMLPAPPCCACCAPATEEEYYS